MHRRAPQTPEIPMAELIRRSDHRGAHGTVFMRTLRPRQIVFGVNPHGESHVILWTAREGEKNDI